MVGVSEFWPILSDLFPEAVFEKNFTVAMQIAAEKEKEASANAEVKAKEAEETWAKLGDKLSSFWGGEGDEKKEGGDEAAAADKKEDADKKEEGDKKVMMESWNRIVYDPTPTLLFCSAVHALQKRLFRLFSNPRNLFISHLLLIVTKCHNFLLKYVKGTYFVQRKQKFSYLKYHLSNFSNKFKTRKKTLSN